MTNKSHSSQQSYSRQISTYSPRSTSPVFPPNLSNISNSSQADHRYADTRHSQNMQPCTTSSRHNLNNSVAYSSTPTFSSSTRREDNDIYSVDSHQSSLSQSFLRRTPQSYSQPSPPSRTSAVPGRNPNNFSASVQSSDDFADTVATTSTSHQTPNNTSSSTNHPSIRNLHSNGALMSRPPTPSHGHRDGSRVISETSSYRYPSNSLRPVQRQNSSSGSNMSFSRSISSSGREDESFPLQTKTETGRFDQNSPQHYLREEYTWQSDRVNSLVPIRASNRKQVQSRGQEYSFTDSRQNPHFSSLHQSTQSTEIYDENEGDSDASTPFSPSTSKHHGGMLNLVKQTLSVASTSSSTTSSSTSTETALRHENTSDFPPFKSRPEHLVLPRETEEVKNRETFVSSNAPTKITSLGKENEKYVETKAKISREFEPNRYHKQEYTSQQDFILPTNTNSPLTRGSDEDNFLFPSTEDMLFNTTSFSRSLEEELSNMVDGLHDALDASFPTKLSSKMEMNSSPSTISPSHNVLTLAIEKAAGKKIHDQGHAIDNQTKNSESTYPGFDDKLFPDDSLFSRPFSSSSSSSSLDDILAELRMPQKPQTPDFSPHLFDTKEINHDFNTLEKNLHESLSSILYAGATKDDVKKTTEKQEKGENKSSPFRPLSQLFLSSTSFEGEERHDIEDLAEQCDILMLIPTCIKPSEDDKLRTSILTSPRHQARDGTGSSSEVSTSFTVGFSAQNENEKEEKNEKDVESEKTKPSMTLRSPLPSLPVFYESNLEKIRDLIISRAIGIFMRSLRTELSSFLSSPHSLLRLQAQPTSAQLVQEFETGTKTTATSTTPTTPTPPFTPPKPLSTTSTENLTQTTMITPLPAIFSTAQVRYIQVLLEEAIRTSFVRGHGRLSSLSLTAISTLSQRVHEAALAPLARELSTSLTSQSQALVKSLLERFLDEIRQKQKSLQQVAENYRNAVRNRLSQAETELTSTLSAVAEKIEMMGKEEETMLRHKLSVAFENATATTRTLISQARDEVRARARKAAENAKEKLTTHFSQEKKRLEKLAVHWERETIERTERVREEGLARLRERELELQSTLAERRDDVLRIARAEVTQREKEHLAAYRAALDAVREKELSTLCEDYDTRLAHEQALLDQRHESELRLARAAAESVYGSELARRTATMSREAKVRTERILAEDSQARDKENEREMANLLNRLLRERDDAISTQRARSTTELRERLESIRMREERMIEDAVTTARATAEAANREKIAMAQKQAEAAVRRAVEQETARLEEECGNLLTRIKRDTEIKIRDHVQQLREEFTRMSELKAQEKSRLAAESVEAEIKQMRESFAEEEKARMQAEQSQLDASRAKKISQARAALDRVRDTNDTLVLSAREDLKKGIIAVKHLQKLTEIIVDLEARIGEMERDKKIIEEENQARQSQLLYANWLLTYYTNQLGGSIQPVDGRNNTQFESFLSSFALQKGSQGRADVKPVPIQAFSAGSSGSGVPVPIPSTFQDILHHALRGMKNTSVGVDGKEISTQTNTGLPISMPTFNSNATSTLLPSTLYTPPEPVIQAFHNNSAFQNFLAGMTNLGQNQTVPQGSTMNTPHSGGAPLGIVPFTPYQNHQQQHMQPQQQQQQQIRSSLQNAGPPLSQQQYVHHVVYDQGSSSNTSSVPLRGSHQENVSAGRNSQLGVNSSGHRNSLSGQVVYGNSPILPPSPLSHSIDYDSLLNPVGSGGKSSF